MHGEGGFLDVFERSPDIKASAKRGEQRKTAQAWRQPALAEVTGSNIAQVSGQSSAISPSPGRGGLGRCEPGWSEVFQIYDCIDPAGYSTEISDLFV